MTDTVPGGHLFMQTFWREAFKYAKAQEMRDRVQKQKARKKFIQEKFTNPARSFAFRLGIILRQIFNSTIYVGILILIILMCVKLGHSIYMRKIEHDKMIEEINAEIRELFYRNDAYGPTGPAGIQGPPGVSFDNVPQKCEPCDCGLHVNPFDTCPIINL